MQVRFNDQIAGALVRLAETRGVPVAELIREAVARFVAAEAKAA
jgi:predicted transcriptional regulator